MIQVGMLKALMAHGWQADMVVGSSVGAISAACFAGDPTAGRRRPAGGDLARQRIVELHGSTIAVDSQAGRSRLLGARLGWHEWRCSWWQSS